jgi:hypothetical protein
MKNSSLSIQLHWLIEKNNLLNEMRANNLTLQELRILSIYLAKINARDPSTKKIRFTLEDFKNIMDLSQVKKSYMIDVVDTLFDKKIHVPAADGRLALVWIHLFNKITLESDGNDKWYVEIMAHDDALPYMFEFKKNYFKYRLWNVLSLTSSNQIRMYEILKQYELAGQRVIAMEELRELIGILPHEHKRFYNFKAEVLDVCQKALSDHTDINFQYEIVERGRAGKVKSLRFIIETNTTYNPPMTLNQLMNGTYPIVLENAESEPCLGIPVDERGDPRFVQEMEFVDEICKHKFEYLQVKQIRSMIRMQHHYDLYGTDKTLKRQHYDYLEEKFNAVLARKPKNLFGYLNFLLDLDLLYKYGPKELMSQFGHKACRNAVVAYNKALLEEEAAVN